MANIKIKNRYNGSKRKQIRLSLEMLDAPYIQIIVVNFHIFSSINK